MDSNFRNNIENINVGIFRNGNSYTAKILSFDNEQPVFTRSFSEMILAIGYCNMVNQLSKESVERVIMNYEL